MKYGELGSLVAANEDTPAVVRAMLDEACELVEAGEDPAVRERFMNELDDFVNELTAWLSDYAAPFQYFGMQHGEYGFWVDHDSLGEAVYEGSVLRVDDLSEVPEDYVGDVLVVNDHGNLSFGYIDESTRKFVETWSCV